MKNILDTNEFHTNQIIRRNKKYKVCVCVCVCVYIQLINYEDFNNLNGNGDMAGTGIMAGICTSPYPIEKVRNFPYPYPYPVNAGIPRQTRDGFGQYPRRRVYLPSLGARPVITRSNISSFMPRLFENRCHIPHFLPRVRQDRSHRLKLFFFN